MAKIRLIVGLGNPGNEYARTRHNAGFCFIDALADVRSCAPLRAESRFHGLCSEVEIDGQSCRLLKPQTYMNQSGRSVSAMISYYRIAIENLLVIHDEIDLPPGTVRLKRGGGHGGHNGLRDMMAALGGRRDFIRLRLGVGHPGNRHQVVDYVLHPPSKAEQISIHHAIDDGLAVLPLLVNDDLEAAMLQLHS